MNLSFPVSRAVRVVALASVLAIVAAPSAHAEGPGYGGNADALTVTWVPASEATPAETTPADTTPADTSPTEAPPVDPGVQDTPQEPAAAAVVLLGGSGRSAGVIVRADGQPSLNPDAMTLQVNGLGFRAKSEVVVRIGDTAPVASRSDTAGGLSVAIDPGLIGGTEPGLTVVAVGRGPSGTAVTLYGSVPPEPSGTGPMSLVPWLVLGVAIVGLVVWARGRRRQVAPADAASEVGAPAI